MLRVEVRAARFASVGRRERGEEEGAGSVGTRLLRGAGSHPSRLGRGEVGWEALAGNGFFPCQNQSFELFALF